MELGNGIEVSNEKVAGKARDKRIDTTPDQIVGPETIGRGKRSRACRGSLLQERSVCAIRSDYAAPISPEP